MLTKSVFGLILTVSTIAASPAMAADNCLFGENVGDLSSQARLKLAPKPFKTIKLSRVGNRTADEPTPVEVTTITDKKTGRVFQLNLTFRHADDGDNAWGWIEEVTDAFEDNGKSYPEIAQVVAKVGDGDFEQCKVSR